MNEQPNAPKFDRLPLPIRNELQMEIMRKMMEEKVVPDEMAWMDNYRALVSDIIDDTSNIEIQNLAKSREYKKAAELVLEKLMVAA